MPRVTVAVCTYNRSAYLKQALQSVIDQTYSDIGIVVYDNASTDDTEEVVRKINDPRLSYIKNGTNLGLFGNLNKALSNCKTEFIVLFHDDDIMLPHMIETEVRTMDKYRDTAIVSCGWNWDIDENNNTILKCSKFRLRTKKYKKEEWIDHICRAKSGSIACPPTMFRANLIKKDNILFSEECGSCADELMWLDLNRNNPVVVIGDYLFMYRRHRHSDSARLNGIKRVNTHKYLLNWLLKNYPHKDISKISDSLVFSYQSSDIKYIAKSFVNTNYSFNDLASRILEYQKICEETFAILIKQKYWPCYIITSEIVQFYAKRLSLSHYFKIQRELCRMTDSRLPLQIRIKLFVKYLLMKLGAYD